MSAPLFEVQKLENTTPSDQDSFKGRCERAATAQRGHYRDAAILGSKVVSAVINKVTDVASTIRDRSAIRAGAAKAASMMNEFEVSRRLGI